MYLLEDCNKKSNHDNDCISFVCVCVMYVCVCVCSFLSGTLDNAISRYLETKCYGGMCCPSVEGVNKVNERVTHPDKAQ